MSSPMSSLKKGKRSPFNARQPTAPYRNVSSDLTPEEMVNDLPSDYLRREVIGRLPKSSHKGPMAAPTDHELLSSMAGRLAQAENELRNTKKEVIEKDKKIKILQEKVQLLGKARGYNSGTISDLERKCFHLQAQVHEMEEFLADYGMVWVGMESTPEGHDYLPLDDGGDGGGDDSSAAAALSTSASSGVWKPASSLANSTFEVDFDRVIKNIKELNILAGEGCAVVSKTKDGARLKVPDSIPLALYSNGIVMFAGPFRPYSDPTTQHCMSDVMDGYFPSELQSKYPDGVPINVTDRRDVVYRDRHTDLLFPGAGQSLDKNTKETTSSSKEVISTLPGHKASVEQFLSRLPQAVIKNGKIIDVRSGVEQSIKGSSGQDNAVIIVNTPALEDIKARAEDNDKQTRRVTSATRVTTLRIKSENGEQTYILKMSFTDTIADLRQSLDAVRPKDSHDYNIKSTFPNKVFTNLEATLEECGLVPNATLHILAASKR